MLYRVQLKMNMFDKHLIKNISMYHIDKRLKVDFYGKKLSNSHFFLFIVVFRQPTYSQMHERFGALKYLGNVSIE